MSSQHNFRLALRTYLPAWNAEKRLAELIAWCQRTNCEQVLLFTAGFEVHPSIQTVAEARDYCAILAPAVTALRAAGIEVGLNVLSTLGHGDYGCEPDASTKWQCQVAPDGTESTVCACPLAPEWRRWAADYYRAYAGLNFNVTFVDDDFRLHNHAPVHWGCFCPLHLERFSKAMGKSYNREQLVAAVLTPGRRGSEERRVWLQILGETMVESAEILRDAVHGVSPETRLAQMSSDPETHRTEGRPWERYLRALCGKHRPLMRPTCFMYVESHARDGACSVPLLGLIRAHVGDKPEFWPEVECHTFSRYSRSARSVQAQTTIAALHGCPTITLDLYDFVGGPLDQDPTYERMLIASRPIWDAIARARPGNGQLRGIGLPARADTPLHRKLGAANYGGLVAGRSWDQTLPLLGVSVTHGPAKVMALTEETIAGASDAELTALLRQGVLLDLTAADYLCERGYSAQIGVQPGDLIKWVSVEEITDAAFGGEAGQFMVCTSAIARKLTLHSGARPISRLLLRGGIEAGPGVVLFENDLGGRVAILPYAGFAGSFITRVPFRNEWRHRQLRAILEWLQRGPLEMVVNRAPDVLPFRVDIGNRALVAVFNLCSDPLPVVDIELRDTFGPDLAIQRLTGKGRWQTVKPEQIQRDNGVVRLQIPADLAYWEALVLLLKAKPA